MSNVFIFLLAGVFATAMVLAVRQQRQGDQRILPISRFAARRGWKYRSSVELAALPQLAQFELFSTGHTSSSRNLVTGEVDGLHVALFDHHYVTGHGKSTRTWLQTVAMVNAPFDLPEFTARPEGLFASVATVFGYQDIDLDRHHEFSDRFLLRGHDVAAIQERFSGDVADYLAGKAPCCVAGNGSVLLFWRTGGFVKPEDLDTLVDDATGLARCFSQTR